MGTKEKILICGDVKGRFKKFCDKIDSIVKKSGAFDFALCVGDFFGDAKPEDWRPYKEGHHAVSLPTYVLGPVKPEQVRMYPDIDGCELGPNVSYLGRRGVYSTTSGFKIAYVSGVSGEVGPSHFTPEDVSAVRDACLKGQTNFRGIDMLLTSTCPAGMDAVQQQNPSPLISWLAVQVKPRYHFSALSNVYFERAPYRNHDTGDNADLSTRFIALSTAGGKEKWIYALNLAPISSLTPADLAQRTTDETPCPYPNESALPGASSSQKDKPSQFFYDMSQSDETGGLRKKRRQETNEERQQRLANQAPCWFCLSSPQVEKHMVISVGSDAYLALAKGGLTPDHVLILPVGHHQAASQIPPEVLDDIKKFKSALRKFFKKRYNKVVVFFERNFRTSHLQIQAVPIPSVLAGMIKPTFLECAEEEKLELSELPLHADLSQVAPPGVPYFHVELPDKEQLFVRARKHFPLQFGRDVMASSALLDMPERADWKECKISPEEEKAHAVKFRTEFKSYDFTV